MLQTTRKFLKPKMIQTPGREEPVLARLKPTRKSRELPPEGDWRPRTSYWRRREAEGSAEEAEAPPSPDSTEKEEG